VAVKEYAWYYVHHWRGGSRSNGCYDVIDNTNDQIYWPEGKSPSAGHVAAVDATWTETVTRTGGLILTGYRSGSNVSCGADADGYRLYQHSAYNCAALGMTAEQILQMYYGPNLTVLKQPAQPTALFETPGAGNQVTSTGSATATWTEETAGTTTVTARRLSLQTALPVNGSCNVDRWLPASPTWASTGTSPQTASGLKDGYCYRFVLSLTDSASATAYSISSTFRADSLAPVASFTTPATGTVAAFADASVVVEWTETPVEGASIVSRVVTQQYAYQPAAGTCVGGQWFNKSQSTAVSPVTFAGMAHLLCYRYVVTLTDSAGHTGSWVSGVLVQPVP
jgi:hypothetical protein